MTKYASSEEIDVFVRQLARIGNNHASPSFVNDLDGNLLTGYSLAANQQLALGPQDNPKNQSIPFGLDLDQIDDLVRRGVLVESLFAAKAMDVRLPKPLVDLVNRLIELGHLFDVTFLTSRSATDALKILRESGVAYPEKLTLVTDSGATLSIDGVSHEVRRLSDSEHIFLENIDDAMISLMQGVHKIVGAMGFDNACCPQLYIESKGVAKNVHYREILIAYGQPDGSELDHRIGTMLKAELENIIKVGPHQPDGTLTFKALDGPATVEVKVASINKGHGLDAIITAACRSPSAPSSVIFTGDDVSKGNGTPGTDYFAMVRAEELAQQHGLPIYTVHTHHPIEGALDSTVPDERLSVDTLSSQYPAPTITLRLPNPRALADLILRTHAILL